MKFSKELKQYAHLVIKTGVNVQPDQVVYISCDVQASYFAELLTMEAYKAKAKKVIVDFYDQNISKLHFVNQSIETLLDIKKYDIDHLSVPMVKDKACRIKVLSELPGVYSTVDGNKLQAYSSKMSSLLKPVTEIIMKGSQQWCVVAYPNKTWASKIFPDKSKKDALKKMFKLLFKMCRVDANAINNWRSHNAQLKRREAILQKYNFKSLNFKNELGTDITVGLVKKHIWCGGRETTPGGIDFNPNIPTEEVFSMPDKYNVNGTVVSTKPLFYNGKEINNFKLTFVNGKVETFSAEVGQDTLEKLLNTDEGSRYIGEVALVAYKTPISQSGVLFYETLFDENASCHLALGASYPMNIKAPKTATREQLDKLGSNNSLVHVDFMFGSKDMNVVGYTYENQPIQIFKDGEFVI